MNRRIQNQSTVSLFVCAILAALACFTSDLAAQQVSATSSETPVDEAAMIGCGKANVMRNQFAALQETAGGVADTAELPTDTDVLHYELDVEITNINTNSDNCTLTGTNRITIQSKSASLTTFTLRLRQQYTITSLLINDAIPVTATTDSITTRTVTLDRAYGMDEIFTLTVGYTGASTSAGFGSFEVRNHNGAPVVSSLSEPYYSYTWWPVKDGDVFTPGDNSDRATTEFSITVPDTLVVASNGLLQSIDILPSARKRYNWSTSYTMPTYLACVAVSNYNTWSTTYTYPGGSMPVEFFIYPENDTPQNRASWENVVNMITVFSSKFGQYPFVNEKYGLYNFPFGGGMEHQTMTGECCFGETLTSHELTHQWWGDNVTCKTWGDIWLNEGFATYGECLWQEYKSGSDDLTAYFSAILARKPAQVGDSVYVYDTTTVNRIFSGTYSYQKGSWVLHQLRHVVGDAIFFQILADYRAAHQGSAATTDDFADSASATAGQDLTQFFDQWVYQIGAPEYVYAWDSVNVGGQNYLHVTIKQTQQSSYPDVFVMPVDLATTIDGASQTFTVQNNLNSQRFVMPVSAPVTALQFDPNQWILRTGATQTNLVVGDMNADLDVDRHDHATLLGCLSGPNNIINPSCVNADFDGDSDVDLHDWIGFQTDFTGCLTGCP